MVPREFLAPYLVSNLIALVMLGLAWRRPRVARWLMVAVFAWAAGTNARFALVSPEVYLEYATLTPSALYRTFIEGWFAAHVAPMVLAIAAGQALIAVFLAGPRAARWAGVLGAVVFLAAIAPLGVGSAFPFSLIFGAAIVLMHRGLQWDDERLALEDARAREASPLTPFIPVPDVREVHEVTVHALPAVAMVAAERIDVHTLPIVSGIFRLRAWAMRATPPPRRWRGGFLDEIRSIGWGDLVRQPGRLLAMGAVTQPWQADVTFRTVKPAEFLSFAEPGLVKIAWTLEAIPIGGGMTRLRTETRASATDAEARRRFLRYWRVAKFGIIPIRWILLPAIRREAERIARVTTHRVHHAA